MLGHQTVKSVESKENTKNKDVMSTKYLEEGNGTCGKCSRVIKSNEGDKYYSKYLCKECNKERIEMNAKWKEEEGAK